MHPRGTLRVMPKGRRVPLPAPVTIRIGKPLVPERKEGSREFTKRVEAAVRRLASGTGREEVTGSWVERWRQTAPRDIRL
jgi:hypothetical protein